LIRTPITLKPGERVDDLMVNGLKIIQNPEAFRFGCDAVELANFVTGGRRDKAFDLGSGTGIITLLLAGKKGIRCTGVEIQSDMAEMSRRSIELNGLEDMCDIINAPLQKLPSIVPAGCATVVVSNPPYRAKKSGFETDNSLIRLARYEIAVTFGEVASAAAYLLGTKGRFYVVHRTERMAEIMTECSRLRLEPKILQTLAPAAGKAPHLFLLKCVKEASRGLAVLPERTVDTWV
jgi:methyltransferase small